MLRTAKLAQVRSETKACCFCAWPSALSKLGLLVLGKIQPILIGVAHRHPVARNVTTRLPQATKQRAATQL